MKNPFFLLVLLAVSLGFSETGKADPTAFETAEGYYTAATLPQLSDFTDSQVLWGGSVYSNNPTVEVAMYQLIYRDTSFLEPQIFIKNYFYSNLTSGWQLSDFVNAFVKTKSHYLPLEVDTTENALKEGNFGTSPTAHYLRVLKTDTDTFYVQKLFCTSPQGCNLPNQSGPNLTYFAPNTVVSYSYFQVK